MFYLHRCPFSSTLSTLSAVFTADRVEEIIALLITEMHSGLGFRTQRLLRAAFEHALVVVRTIFQTPFLFVRNVPRAQFSECDSSTCSTAAGFYRVRNKGKSHIYLQRVHWMVLMGITDYATDVDLMMRSTMSTVEAFLSFLIQAIRIRRR